ncbi:ABC transporter ATP-binding protein [Epibacterium sp. MM17-32]|jgi:putative spermidine/putrescine transport system ATP-binding protein|uniref:ABC transporter ATP-binding protein n=1 Tax=Epibacterium sp. MM17-32 TaxID=2917734 RepID=UPI001EF5AD22|nr:ABC transporter ATP-binding protein [Epibacterium sp. MM17-32]MCG7630154.1 ABC transporter ATP-binding protein [Epibacterium sp. MM17-32]
MSFLTLTSVTKSFGQNTVVKGFDFVVQKGEFISFLGPSGCGKTTVLRMIAGFETPTSGQIRINGQDVTALPANKRRIGMVFQAYALFPNMTVRDNVAFGLKIDGMARREIDARVSEMLALIQLDHLGGRYPYELSGGQQQRVALARALAPKPQLLLLDEPLSALDAKIRVSLRDDIRRIQRDLGITTVFVTHDQEEALSISDRVVVMHQGRADQVGTPSQIYNRPETRFVAGFVGHLNTFEAVKADDARVVFAGQMHPSDRPLHALPSGAPVTVALRPEALALTPRTPEDVALTGRVLDVNFLGSVIRAKVEVQGQPVALDMFNQAGATMPSVGHDTQLWFSGSDLLVLPE